MVIHAIGPGLDALGGGGIGILLDEGRPFADGLLDGGVGDDIAGERDVGFQELPGDGGDAFVDLEGFIAAAGHIDHDADAGDAIARSTEPSTVPQRTRLQDSISIGDGGGFRRGNDDDVVGGGGEGEDVAADAGAGVDDEGVGGFIDGFEFMDDAFAVGL